MKSSLAILLFAVSMSATAAEYSSIVSGADCQQLAHSNNVGSTIAGTTIGAGLGGWVGKKLFGKTGAAVGALISGSVGAYAGETYTGTVSYRCVVRFADAKGMQTASETVGQKYVVGQRIKVIDTGRQLIVN